jgi:two-component system phosphate regulon response regulator OmpR
MAFSDKQSEHLLVVDDDPRIRQMLIRYFEGEGYQVTAVGDGAAMRAAVERQAFTAIFLDLVLPGGEDGLSLLRDIRTRSDVPVLMLTGRDDVLDKVVGLEVGADDYIAKPFHLREVLARLRTILRRRQPIVNGAKNASEDETLLRFDGWTLDIDRRKLLAPSSEEIPLTTGEFDMLSAFVRHAGRVLSRERLMDLTRHRSLEAFDRTIDAQIARLRRKIEADPKDPILIKSVRGVGYLFTGKVL